MLLKHIQTGHLIEVEDLRTLTNPFATEISGRELWGEEPQELERFEKRYLVFPSGEQLPHCWWDAHYHDPTVMARHPGLDAEAAGYHGA
ncbi:acetyltransferase [Marinobacteraceae bacterium S3BR75-40.1]